MSTDFSLYIPPIIEARLLRLRRSARDAIAVRLSEVLQSAALSGTAAPEEAVDPPLRVYAEEYRVFYRVDPREHRVVVLEVRRSHR